MTSCVREKNTQNGLLQVLGKLASFICTKNALTIRNAAAARRSLEGKPQSALRPPARHVGALFNEAVDDYAVAVNSRVLVVEGVDESLGQVEQALEGTYVCMYVHWYSVSVKYSNMRGIRQCTD